MRPARILPAVITAIVAAVIAWLGLDLWASSGGDALPLPWTAVAGTVALALVVISAGVPVRQWIRGRRSLDPLVAARTAVLAKAAAYGGALLAGWYAAQAIDILPDVVGDRRLRLILAISAAVAAVGISAAGFVVQEWCRVPKQDDDEDQDEE